MSLQCRNNVEVAQRFTVAVLGRGRVVSRISLGLMSVVVVLG